MLRATSFLDAIPPDPSKSTRISVLSSKNPSSHFALVRYQHSTDEGSSKHDPEQYTHQPDPHRLPHGRRVVDIPRAGWIQNPIIQLRQLCSRLAQASPAPTKIAQTLLVLYTIIKIDLTRTLRNIYTAEALCILKNFKSKGICLSAWTRIAKTILKLYTFQTGDAFYLLSPDQNYPGASRHIALGFLEKLRGTSRPGLEAERCARTVTSDTGPS